jgi:hypothetical protein
MKYFILLYSFPIVSFTILSQAFSNNIVIHSKVLVDSIAVVSPNGGEMLQAGETHIITWFDDLDEPVKIELYKNESLHFLISSNTPSDGIYNWTIPYDEVGGSDYKIKITSTQFTTKFDFSDSNFTITANEVTITSPLSGDNWHAGTSQLIMWDSNFDDNVSINLFKGGNFYKLISSSTENDGSYNWNIAFDEVAGSDYQIRIGSLVNSAVSDFSDFFTITANQITITSPNGGENWYKDSTQVITWTDNITGDVKIELFEEDNLDDNTPIIITNQTPSNGSFIWHVSSEVEPSTEYRIKITMLSDQDIFDFSDTSFSFISELQLIVPNGGEVWQINTSKTISYVKNFNTNVMIELYKGGVFYLLIDPDDGGNSRNWDIPATLELGNDYRIKITSLHDPDSFDYSDSDFTIKGDDIVLISPNGGEVWALGSTQDITWTSINVVDVKIELSLNNGASWLTIIDSTLSTGGYSWFVNPPQETNQALIRISDITDVNIADQSDDVFTIDILPGVEDVFSGIPDSYKLLQNYPNPFNPITTIYYGLPEESEVTIIIFDVLGNEVLVFSEEKQTAGYHNIKFDATDYRSGIYFYRLQAGDYLETKKMVLMK